MPGICFKITRKKVKEVEVLIGRIDRGLMAVAVE